MIRYNNCDNKQIRNYLIARKTRRKLAINLSIDRSKIFCHIYLDYLIRLIQDNLLLKINEINQVVELIKFI